jgi:AraC-like DNA-binding protein
MLEIPEGTFYLLLIIHTPSRFKVNGKMLEYPPDSAALFHPGQLLCYGATKGKFINDWIRFSSTDTFIASTILPHGIPFPLRESDFCSKLVQLIYAENNSGSSENFYREISINNLMITLLNKMTESYANNFSSEHYHKLVALRTKITSEYYEEWSVKKMADIVHISPGYLQSLYKLTFGISCIDDVIQNRILTAKTHLAGKNYLVSEIASLCGYKSTEHFCRQFKHITGYTPSEYMSSAAAPTVH